MSNLIFNLLIAKLSNSQLWQSKVWAKISLKTLIKSFPSFKSMYNYFQNQLRRSLHFQLAHALLPLSKKESRSPWTKFYRSFHYFTIENNALVLPHFISTPSNRKISTPLLRSYAQTVFKVFVKVWKSAQFENFAFLCHQNLLTEQILQL